MQAARRRAADRRFGSGRIRHRDFSTELDDAERLLALGIESPTLKKQVFKRLAFKYLCDVRQEVKDRIAKEIDESFERRLAAREEESMEEQVLKQDAVAGGR